MDAGGIGMMIVISAGIVIGSVVLLVEGGLPQIADGLHRHEVHDAGLASD